MQQAHFVPTPSDTEACRVEAERRWSHLRTTASTEPSEQQVLSAHASIHAAAVELSGTTLDARKRAVLYYSVYEDSHGNFMFPLVATHGSMWGVSHTQRIDALLRRMEPLSRRGSVTRWLEALDAVRNVNRRVFIEVYSTFYFTRFYGQHPAARLVIKPEVLALYNRVHAAVSSGVPLTQAERRELYFDIFVHEQNDIVDPGVKEAAEVALAAPGGRALMATLKRVSPRFTYFPRRERLWFTDFVDVEQRNREGLRALDFAEEVGPERVLAALSEY